MSVIALTKRRSRRTATIDVTPELILELLKVKDADTIMHGKVLTFQSDPIPATAIALRCGLTARGDIRILLEDESFDEVSEGDTPIPLHPTYNWTLRTMEADVSEEKPWLS